MTFPALYLDTETSDYHEEQSPSLPVQIAAVLADEHRILATICCIINQRAWQGIRENLIAQRVIDIHGITPEMCDLFGWAPDLALGRLRQMLSVAQTVVAHNAPFDLSVIDHATVVQRIPAMSWPAVFCTMRESAAIVRIPSNGRYSIDGWKAPRLAEAHRHFTKQEMSRAHDALFDVFACRRVHQDILKYRSTPIAKQSEAASG